MLSNYEMHYYQTLSTTEHPLAIQTVLELLDHTSYFSKECFKYYFVWPFADFIQLSIHYFLYKLFIYSNKKTVCYRMFQRKEYVKYAKVFPLSEVLNFKIPAKWYRRVIGSLEIIAGFALAFIPLRELFFLSLKCNIYI